MTARADRLTKRAKTPRQAAFLRSSYPASSARVFVDALERLNYCMGPPLAHAGIGRADLDDPDARVPIAVWGPMFRRALGQRPMQNAGMRLAAVTPIGAFPLIDYLIATSQDVGEGLTRLARYQRLAEARSVPCLLGDEEPIGVLLEGCDTPFSAEFTVTLNLLHFREETEGRLGAAYASFCHTKDAAERYLTNSPLSISEVAYVLGYSEPAAFNRAFRRWHNETPQAFRQRQRGERIGMTALS